jgi:hypothetical protein
VFWDVMLVIRLEFSDNLEEHSSFKMSGYMKPVTLCHISEYLDFSLKFIYALKELNFVVLFYN